MNVWTNRCGHWLLGCALAAMFVASGASADDSEAARFARWQSCAALLYPDGAESTSDLQARIERPESIQQMLQNLKRAWDQDWLLQPNFYDSDTLLKFLNGTKLSWKKTQTDQGVDVVESIDLDADSSIFPRATVSIFRTCSVYVLRGIDGRVGKRQVVVGGNLYITGPPERELTLRDVRNVFGHETQNAMDTGESLHGQGYTPDDQGTVTYRDPEKQRRAGSAIGVTFWFALRPPPPPGGWRKYGPIVDDDIVQTIQLGEQRYKTLEK